MKSQHTWQGRTRSTVWWASAWEFTGTGAPWELRGQRSTGLGGKAAGERAGPHWGRCVPTEVHRDLSNAQCCFSWNRGTRHLGETDFISLFLFSCLSLAFFSVFLKIQTQLSYAKGMQVKGLLDIKSDNHVSDGQARFSSAREE